MSNHLHSNHLVPFKKRRDVYHLPGGAADREERLTSQVDHDLSAEEQGFIRHYLGYADTLLRNAPREDSSPNENIIAIPGPEQEDPGDKAA